MTNTAQQYKDMLEAAKPLIKWMNQLGHYHFKCIVQVDRVELLETKAMDKTQEFLK